ncbi:MAG: LytR C-terminal domain-containing protein, partial [Actinomycetales bacterium]
AGAAARPTAGAASGARASSAVTAAGFLGSPGADRSGAGEAPLRPRRTTGDTAPGHRSVPESSTARIRPVPGDPSLRERSTPGDPTLRVVTRPPAPPTADPGPETSGEAVGGAAAGPFEAFGARPAGPGPASPPAPAARRRRAALEDDADTLRRRPAPSEPVARARRSFDGVPDALRGLRPPAGSTRAVGSVSALDEPPRARLPVSAPILGAGATALVVLLLVLVLVFRPGGDTAPSAALVPSDSPRQDTVLVTLLDEDATILRGLLMAVGPSLDGPDQVVPVIVPGDLTVAVPDAGSLPLAQTPSVGPEASDRAVEDLLGVRVDGTWVMDRGLLADFVDTAGGVEVDVATAVTAGDVTVPVGPGQRLTGAQAAAYATASVEGEEPEVSLARFAQVVLGLVAAMPPDAGEVTGLLSQVDRHPDTTATSEHLTGTLAEASRVLADEEDPAPLTVPIAEGGEGPPAADLEAVDALVGERLQGARLSVATAGPLRVVVGNAVGQSGLVTAARDRLVAAGFRFVGGGTVEGEPAPETTVLVPSDTPENRERGQAVAAALGIPPDALFVKADFEADVPEGTEIIVWLGQDYADTLEGEE